MANELFTYFVSGKVYVREYGSLAAFEWPGLVDTVTLGVTENVITLDDRTQPGGGVYDQVRRIQTVNLTLNHREIKASTLAQALFGENQTVVAGTVANEEAVASPDGFVPLAHPGPYTSVVVTTDASPAVTIAADQYELVPGGIHFFDDADEVDTAGTDVLIDYHHPAYTRTQALRTSAPLLEIFFAGENEARADKEVTVRLHKVRLGALAEQAILSGDDFGALQLQGEVLKDTSIVGGGLSQFFYEDLVQ